VAADPSLPEGVRSLLRALEAPANQPFARELWTTDAASLLGRILVPVLVIIGKKDIPVDWQVDGESLQRAATGRTNVTFVFPENANHVLKYEPKPRAELNAADVMQRYNAAGASLDPGSIAVIQEWLLNHA
jgi:alpha-beta hydrolase superfamily lysophospholipase